MTGWTLPQPMKRALELAEAAAAAGEVPVGAVVTRDGKVIAEAHNAPRGHHDPTAHAEILALTQAAEAVGTWRLSGANIYVTLEPCPMCAGALVNARVDRLVFGVTDQKSGACGTLWNLVQSEKLNHRMEVSDGLMADQCLEILQGFFRRKRESEE